MLWAVDVYPKESLPDCEGQRVLDDARACGIGGVRELRCARAFLLEGDLTLGDLQRIAVELLADPVLDEWHCYEIGRTDNHNRRERHVAARFYEADGPVTLIQVLRKPGVMDPVAMSCARAVRDLGLEIARAGTFRKYWVRTDGDNEAAAVLAQRVLANESIERVVFGELSLEHLTLGSPCAFQLVTVPIRQMADGDLERLSREGQLYLGLREMQTIRGYFRDLGRDPTDAELETLAQTWSEHCSHKTLKGRIHYTELDADGQVVREIRFSNLLKETVFAATQQVREGLGPQRDWCVSVFEDNAGIVRFDAKHNVCFKVETHNHPSAIEPYGGANTGLGGVIRDVLGTGLGARPVANTDVFCFAPPEMPFEALPPGVLHPRRVMKGVVAGVRDYGNRMGIPTVNGAVFFDPRYLANPLVYCGTVGIVPIDRCRKEPRPGDLIVAVGGRTGRDGIHGATFSSAELTHESEALSGGAVQIGNAITEKMMLDVLLEARDRGLYTAITDCGAGGFSSAVGEMGAEIGAEVWLECAPLKYDGLSYTEVWISEAQERMVLAVPPEHWDELHLLCAGEDVEATVIGEFRATGRLVLKFQDHTVADLDMQFLHDGRPAVVRDAVYRIEPHQCANLESEIRNPRSLTPNHTDTLRRILGSLNVCSKEWIIRQYDHEVQGGSVIKPLVGATCDGPSDAAVVQPVLNSNRGLVIACGMNPRYGDLDPYWMAASAIDEAVRNCVAVGADPERIALLDNFCWGNTDRPETLGTLVRAALACRDIASEYGTPFISGKDSLNNEFTYKAGTGGPGFANAREQTISIPPSLLISALGQIDDVNDCVTMDLKAPGNLLYLVGATHDELGGSHYALVHAVEGGRVPKVDRALALATFRRLHHAIRSGLVRSCHDLSEGGLAVALAEMAFAGALGAKIDLHAEGYLNGSYAPPEDPFDVDAEQVRLLFSESNSRFLVEVLSQQERAFIEVMESDVEDERADVKVPFEWLGRVTPEPVLTITDGAHELGQDHDNVILQGALEELRECWQQPLRWGHAVASSAQQ